MNLHIQNQVHLSQLSFCFSLFHNILTCPVWVADLCTEGGGFDLEVADCHQVDQTPNRGACPGHGGYANSVTIICGKRLCKRKCLSSGFIFFQGFLTPSKFLSWYHISTHMLQNLFQSSDSGVSQV